VLYSLVPIVFLLALFSKQTLLLLSGDQYTQFVPMMLPVMYLFLFYGLLLPVDRFTGIALDSAELPNLNAIKVQIMLAMNIIGDVIAVFVFESLVMVAMVTIVFTIAGILLGWYFLISKFKVKPVLVIQEGLRFYSNHISMSNLKKLITK